MIKTILGYDIEPGVTPEEYDRWIFEEHVPDILANPFVQRLTFNTVIRPVERNSAGPYTGPKTTFYRVAEMEFADEAGYAGYLAWFDEHPLPPERGPAGRTDFKFYLLTDCVEASRGPDGAIEIKGRG